ncbi:MAG: trigger factor [Sediminispirochaetaceae bacterium]
MVTQKEVENLENSSVRLTVTVDKNEAKTKYDELLKKYAKTAQIKGFRKGKVPPQILEQKYGEGIKEEAMINIIEESLKEVIDEVDQKPLPYSRPALDDEDNTDLSFDEDFTYSVVYDVYPDIELGEYKGLEIEEPQVKVLKKDVDRELEQIREQNAMVVEKEEGALEKDDIVTVDYVELDENDEEKEDTRRSEFVFTLGTEYNIYKFDNDIIGMKKGEEKVIEKEFPEDYEYQDYAGKKVKIKVKVTVIKKKELPELDDELAQDVSEEYETLEDLRTSIKKRLEEDLKNRLREKKIEKLFDQIIESSTIPLPESMIQAELENSWNNFVQQARIGEEQVLKILEAQGKTKEDLLSEWRENAERSLKFQLLVEKIKELEPEAVEVSEEEIDEEIKKNAENNDREFEELKQYFEDNNMMEYVQSDVKNRKLFDFLIEQSKIKKGEKIDYLDFMGQNN